MEYYVLLKKNHFLIEMRQIELKPHNKKIQKQILINIEAVSKENIALNGAFFLLSDNLNIEQFSLLLGIFGCSYLFITKKHKKINIKIFRIFAV